MPSPRDACPGCYLRQVCPIGSLLGDGRSPPAGTFHTRKVASHEALLRVGQLANTVYVVRTGLVKSYAVTSDGSEHVRAFHLPGELLGIDALVRAQSTSFVEAMTTSTVCGIDGHEAWSLADTNPEFRRRLVAALGQRIEHGENHACAVAKLSADRRVAALLGELAQRFARLGYARRGLELRLPRRDMADYLGLTVETVSRAVARLQAAGIVGSRRAGVVIHDPERLAAVERGGPGPVSSLPAAPAERRASSGG